MDEEDQDFGGEGFEQDENFDADDTFEAEQPADGIDVLQEQQPQGAAADRPRITTRYMTKYERARVLGTRALQIRCEFEHVWRPPDAQTKFWLAARGKRLDSISEQSSIEVQGQCALKGDLNVAINAYMCHLQLCSMNAPVMVALDGETDPLEGNERGKGGECVIHCFDDVNLPLILPTDCHKGAT
eukprot:scaffold140598_cov19-Tisochrysis_lutea.AAC.1